MTTILQVHRTLDPNTDPMEYLELPLEVPADTIALRGRLRFEKVTDRFQLYLALFDPDGGFRGHVQCPGGPGPRDLELVVSAAGSSYGCLDGPVPAGTWTARIDMDRLVEAGGVDLQISAHGQDDPIAARNAPGAPGGEVLAVPGTARELPGWSAGELHSHSRHSDGAADVTTLVAAAERAELSFLAVSDHFTWSHWAELEAQEAQGCEIALLRSIEVTSHYGHANVHGLSAWPGTYLDGPDWGFEELAAEVHRQGGLVSVNHPFSGRQAWRRDDAPWSSVDLLEVANAGQGANDDAAVGLWDRLLAQGHRVHAIAGTDCHDPHDPESRLGDLTTLLRGEVRGPGEVIEHLRAGRACLSRGGALAIDAASGSQRAAMGGELRAYGPVTLEVEVIAPEPAVLFVFRDGLLWHLEDISPGRVTREILDSHPIAAPYRAELHAADDAEQFWASCSRSHASLLALSNPVWVV